LWTFAPSIGLFGAVRKEIGQRKSSSWSGKVGENEFCEVVGKSKG